MKKSNGVNSQSLLIFIHTNKTAKDCESEVVKWFLNCLTPMAQSICEKNYQCDFKIISNIQDNDNLNEDDNKTLWVGGYKSVGKYGGFDKIDLKTNNISMLNPEGEIYCIFPDRNNKNILWNKSVNNKIVGK